MKPEFKVIVAGSRHFSDFDLMVDRCDFFLKEKIVTHRVVIVSGTAKGADQLGEKYAELRGLSVMKFRPNWNKLGNMAGIVRNAEMLEVSDSTIVFWDGSSRGSQHMISITKRSGKPLRVVRF